MGLDIIGPGFGRTGTNSLKLALEQLGFGPCHHMFEVRDNPEQLATWQAAARGEPADWGRVFAGFRSQVDWPGARYWRELIECFPEARVILSVRAPEKWFESVQATIAPFMRDRRKHKDSHARAIGEMAYETVVRQVFDERLDDRDHAIAVFERHIAEVQRSVSPERLLTFDVSEGWEPLCRFLEVPTPATAFPRVNSSNEFKNQEWKDKDEARMS